MPEESPTCFRCGKKPEDLNEYQAGGFWEEGEYESADDYCRSQEGTFNPASNHFACTQCYIEIGQPSSKQGWKAP